MELIDTLWNVNLRFLAVLELPETELIDTLWNVNLHSTKSNVMIL